MIKRTDDGNGHEQIFFPPGKLSGGFRLFKRVLHHFSITFSILGKIRFIFQYILFFPVVFRVLHFLPVLSFFILNVIVISPCSARSFPALRLLRPAGKLPRLINGKLNPHCNIYALSSSSLSALPPPSSG